MPMSWQTMSWRIMSWHKMMTRTSRLSCGEWKKLQGSPLFTRPDDCQVAKYIDETRQRWIMPCEKKEHETGKLTSAMFQRTPLTRREMLTAAALGLVTLPTLASLAWPSRRKTFEE